MIDTAPFVRPLGANVVVQPVRDERTMSATDGGLVMDVRVLESGIALSDTVDNTPLEGYVVALGDGYEEGCAKCDPNGRRHVFGVAVGQRVVWEPWKATMVRLEGVESFIIPDRDIIGIVSEG